MTRRNRERGRRTPAVEIHTAVAYGAGGTAGAAAVRFDGTEETARLASSIVDATTRDVAREAIELGIVLAGESSTVATRLATPCEATRATLQGAGDADRPPTWDAVAAHCAAMPHLVLTGPGADAPALDAKAAAATALAGALRNAAERRSSA